MAESNVELKQRATRLKKILEKNAGKKLSSGFQAGVQLATEIISGKTVKQDTKHTMEALDAILDTLDAMDI